MATETMTDEQLAEKYGRRPEGQPLFEPQEFGYRCPEGHRGDYITWSEFNEHIWCYKCNLEYLSSECPLQRPSWMKKEDWKEFLAKLPFKPKVLPGLDKSLEALDKRIRERG